MADLERTAVPPVDDVVRSIYGPLSEDMGFERILEAVGRALRSHISALHTVDLKGARSSLKAAVGMSQAEFAGIAESYATRWSGQNPWMCRGMSVLLARGYADADAVVSEAELIRSDYYQHFLRPLDIRYSLAISVLNDEHSCLSVITVNRSRSAGPFHYDEVRLVEQLKPHLVNAHSISSRLSALQDTTASLREAFDHAPVGMIVLDVGGHVVEQNATAARQLAAHPGISLISDHTLRLACPVARTRVRDALYRLGRASSLPMPECVCIAKSRQSGGKLVLHMCAFPTPAAPVRNESPRILGFLCELDGHRGTSFDCYVLQSALDLTPMEAKVLMSLRDHNDPIGVGMHLGVQISTVRTHLKHLFSKTGTTRQSELLRLADRLLSAAPD